MPNREYRDPQGRALDQFVADQVMAAIIDSGMSVRQVARITGLNRSTLQRRVNNDGPSFNMSELAQIAQALDIHPRRFFEGL